MLCLAIGAVVVGVPTTCQTPLSGHRSPVFAVVPMGTFVCVIVFLLMRSPAIAAFDDHNLRTALVTIPCSASEFSRDVFSKTGILEHYGATADSVEQRMSDTFDQILAAADWKEITPRLLYYADNLIRGCAWRGLRIQAKHGSKICVEGCGADDFVQEAIERLINGRRHYNQSVTLEQNLKGIIRSMIWSLNKSSRRRGVTELSSPTGVEGVSATLEDLPSNEPSAVSSVVTAERLGEERKILEAFEKSLAHEPELLKLVAAYKAEHYTPRSVEKFVAIPATRVSELKRKLRRRMEQFEAQIVHDDQS